MNKTPHIVFDIPDYFPAEFDQFLLKDIDHKSLDIKICRSEVTAWAATEWIIPGIIAVYILKPYFESFLSEAGKDHYQLLRKKLSELLGKAKDMKVQTISSTPKKLNSMNTQSKAISFYFQISNGMKIKLLYDNELSLDVWIRATDELLKMIEMNYESGADDPISIYLKSINNLKAKDIYAFIDPVSLKWRFIFDLGEFDRQNKLKQD